LPWINILREKFRDFNWDFVNINTVKHLRTNDLVVLYGDPHVIDYPKIHSKNVIVMHDTPLFDCDIYKENPDWLWLPSSRLDKEIIEECGTKNYGDILHKPMIIPDVGEVEKRFDYVVNLTQPFRKGDDKLAKILKQVQREVSMLLIMPKSNWKNFENIKNVKITFREPKYKDYTDVLIEMKSGKTMIFPSYIEGIGLPPIEAYKLGLDIIMSDGSAHNEFVRGVMVPTVDIDVAIEPNLKKHFMYQYWDEEYMYKVIEGDIHEKPTLLEPDVFDPVGLGSKLISYFR